MVDATNRILIPGFVDTHSDSYQGRVRGILVPAACSTPTTIATFRPLFSPAFQPDDAYRGGAGVGARLHRYGHDVDRRYLAEHRHAGTHRRHVSAHSRNPASGCSMPIIVVPGPALSIHRTSNGCRGLIQLERPAADTCLDGQPQRNLCARPRDRRADREEAGRRRPQQAGASTWGAPAWFGRATNSSIAWA